MKNNNKQPLVSVIMPVYNAQDFIEEAIKSVIKQTYKNWELIIVNDASEDNSLKIINKFAKKYPKRIKAIHLKKNLNAGGDAAGNIAYKESHGDFIARMDADDVMIKDRLERQVRYMSKNPKCGTLGSSAWVIDADGKIIGKKVTSFDHDEIYKEYFVLHPMIHPTVMVRRSALVDKNNLYHIVYKANNDYLSFFEMLSKGVRFANLKKPLLYYRMHGKNDSLTNIKRNFINSLKIRWYAATKLNYKPSIFSVIKLLTQVVIVIVLPEKFIYYLYMFIRGIYTPRKILSKIKENFFKSLGIIVNKDLAVD